MSEFFEAALADLQDALPAHWAHRDETSELAKVLQAIAEQQDELAATFEVIHSDQALATATLDGLQREWARIYGADHEILSNDPDQLLGYLQARASEDGTVPSLESALLGLLRTPVNDVGTTLTFGPENLVVNPSFETDTNGWTTFSNAGGAPTLTRTSTAAHIEAGSFAAQVAGTNSAGAGTQSKFIWTTAQTSMAAGEYLYIRAKVSGAIGAGAADYRLGYRTQAGAVQQTSLIAVGNGITKTNGNNGWVLEGILPYNGNGLVQPAVWASGVADGAAYTFGVDGIMAVKIASATATPPGYFDGDAAGCGWTGTPHASSSVTGLTGSPVLFESVPERGSLVFPADGTGLTFPAAGSAITVPPPGRVTIVERFADPRVEVQIRSSLNYDSAVFARACERFRLATHLPVLVTEVL